MSYKTDDPEVLDQEIIQDNVEEELDKAFFECNEVVCLICHRTEYTRVYIVIPQIAGGEAGVRSVTIDDPDRFLRLMQVSQVRSKFPLAKTELVFR